MALDDFPNAFERFQRIVDVDKIESFRQLRLAFASWAGSKWFDSPLQLSALRVEAEKHNIPLEALTWRHEFVSVRNRGQHRYRDLKTGRFIRKP